MTTRDAEIPHPHIELIPASPGQKPILANLLELYVHDFSQFLHIELGPDGRFGYANLSAYWREPGRHPFLVRVDGNLAGFVFVKRDDSTWDMAEFFIVRGHRRAGIGTAVAHNVFRLFPGRWQVRVIDINQPARRFWQQAIHQFTGHIIQPARVQKGGQNWHVFSFESSDK